MKLTSWTKNSPNSEVS